MTYRPDGTAQVTTYDAEGRATSEAVKTTARENSEQTRLLREISRNTGQGTRLRQ